MSIKKLFRRPRMATVVVAAVVAAAVAVTPSFAGSFLTRQAAHAIYVTKKSSRNLFVSQKSANKDLATKADAPFALASASTAVFNTDSAVPILVPASDLSFKTKADTALVVVTFSGVSTCDAPVSGRSCPIRIFVDGQLASTGSVPFDLTTSKAQNHSVTESAIISKGGHAVDVAYGGNSNGDTNFHLLNWNLVVQVYPGASAH